MFRLVYPRPPASRAVAQPRHGALLRGLFLRVTLRHSPPAHGTARRKPRFPWGEAGRGRSILSDNCRYRILKHIPETSQAQFQSPEWDFGAVLRAYGTRNGCSAREIRRFESGNGNYRFRYRNYRRRAGFEAVTGGLRPRETNGRRFVHRKDRFFFQARRNVQNAATRKVRYGCRRRKKPCRSEDSRTGSFAPPPSRGLSNTFRRRVARGVPVDRQTRSETPARNRSPCEKAGPVACGRASMGRSGFVSRIPPLLCRPSRCAAQESESKR